MPETKTMAALLARHTTLKLATSGGPASPWVATAYFADEDLFELVVMIEHSGKSLANIRQNPKVAVMLENGNPLEPFAQGSGTARVQDADRDRIREAVIEKTPSSKDLMSIPSLVPVAIAIERWLITDIAKGWLPAHELKAPATALAERASPGALLVGAR